MELVNSQPGLILVGIHCSGFTAAQPQICAQLSRILLEAFKEVNLKGFGRWIHSQGDVGI